MSIISQSLRRWAADNDERRTVLGVMDAASIKVDYLHTTNDSDAWGLFVKLPAELASVFATQREVLVWYCGLTRVEARDVQLAVDTLHANSVRLSQTALIFIYRNPEAAQMVRESSEHLDATVAAASLASLRNYRPFASGLLSDMLRTRLFARDLYDLKGAIRHSSDFFGRRTILADLRAEIRGGTSHLGVFGLRKIGKTSLVNQLASSTRGLGGMRVVHLDLQRINAINPTAPYLLWSLGEAIYDADKRMRKSGQWRLFGLHEMYADMRDRESIWEAFDHDLRALLAASKYTYVIMLDEIERIFPQRAGGPWSSDFVRVWQLLRGIDQENQGRLRFVISGTNPQCVEEHAVLGIDNPIYDYFTVRYLGPLDETESGDLLRSYGDRMGLTWRPAAVHRAFEDTGGHPALLRAYASLIHKRFSGRVRTVTPTVDDAREVAAEFLVRENRLLAQVVAILEDQYTDEFEILKTLALGRVHEFQELAREFPNDTAHLIGYGLCVDPARASRVASGLLQTYLQERDRVTPPVTPPRFNSLVGTEIDDSYKLVSLVSDRGGYADVYKAIIVSSEAEEFAAVKIMRDGKLSVLEREVEVLQSMQHRNIVRVLSSGRVASGEVYLAMEYLNGETLRAYCSTARRPSEATLLGWAEALLAALTVMHPKAEEIRSRRSTQGDGEDSLQAILEARYGYIHRDIKPENVIVTPDRGPVLIDFNISVKASTPVGTISGTPGYLSAVNLGGSWDVTSDLHQLGLTLLQVAVGVEYDGSNVDDLTALLQSSCSGDTTKLIAGLIEAPRDGFKTAFTARRAAVVAQRRVAIGRA